LSYRLVVEFSTVEELVRKLRALLSELEGRAEASARRRGPVRVLCDETVRRLGERLLAVSPLELEVYEANSSISEEVVIGGVRHVPVSGDLDIVRRAKELGAVLVTGDKRLARTAEAQGIRVVYLPPAGAASAEHYAMEVARRLERVVSSGEGLSGATAGGAKG